MHALLNARTIVCFTCSVHPLFLWQFGPAMAFLTVLLQFMGVHTCTPAAMHVGNPFDDFNGCKMCVAWLCRLLWLAPQHSAVKGRSHYPDSERGEFERLNVSRCVSRRFGQAMLNTAIPVNHSVSQL